MKLGIVGNGMIVKTVLHELKKTDIESTALWCRSEERGKPVAEAFNIKKVYTDYDAFLKDESFDTVYIGLTNNAHYEYAKKALLAHKHVIVEKPFTSTYSEARDLFRTAVENNVFLFEAMLTRYSANYEAISSHLDEIGELRLVRSTYCQYSSRYDAYLRKEVKPAFDPELSGGALMDINVYNISFVTGLFGAPMNAYYMANIGFNGIDTSGVLTMDYGSFKAVCTGAKDCSGKNGIMIQGTKGWIEVPDRPGFIANVTLHKYEDNSDILIDVAKESPYEVEFERIAEVIEKKDVATMYNWLNNSLQTMLVLENARQDAGIVFSADERE